MKNYFKAVLFDLDGTLVDSQELIFQSFNFALKQQGFPPISRKKMPKITGIPLSKIYPVLFPKANIQKLVSDHTKFSLKNIGLAKAYPNAKEVLEKLKKKKIKIAVVTGRYKKTAQKIMKKTGLKRFVDVIVAGDEKIAGKPSAQPFLKAMKKIGVKPKDSLVVGDGWVDVVAGKKAKCLVCRAMYGYGATEKYSEKPNFKIKKIEELLKLFS